MLRAVISIWILFVTSGSLLGQKSANDLISSGLYHSMAIKEDGTVVAWGRNDVGQCDVPYGLKAVSISAGDYHSMALKEDGTVVAWGMNRSGQCDFPDGLKAVSISAGFEHSMVIEEDGTVVAWGDNSYGQCDVPYGLKAVSISAGFARSMALKEDGTVVAWGMNHYGQCDVPYGLKAVSISAGSYHSMALKEDGTVVAWGSHEDGQCDFPDGLKAVSISAGNGLFKSHSMALKEDGTVVAWGFNRSGQCDVPYGLKAVSISSGSYHSMALKEDGTVVAWGMNNYGQCDVPKAFVATSTSDLQTDDKPPLLQIKSGSISISGPTVISGMDSKTISFDLMNISGGNATGLEAHIRLEGQSSGISIPTVIELPSVQVGQTRNCEISLTTNRTTDDGVVQIVVEVIEPNGFSPSPFALELPTKSFKAPQIEVVDFTCSLNTWKPLTPIRLDILVQNVGKGDAFNFEAELYLPSSVACLSENQTFFIGDLPKGEMVILKYDLLVARSFNESEITPSLKLKESYGDYGSNWSQQFTFERMSEVNVIRYSEVKDESNDESNDEIIAKGSFSSKTGSGGDVTFRETNAGHIVTTVAVVPKQGENCSGEKVNGDDLALFTENQLLGTYNIVDRKFIDQTLGEIKFTMSGMTKENQILEAGCMMAAEGYVFVDYGCFEGVETVNIKMIHCESGENMWISQGISASASETVQAIVSGLAK
jgi:alpha-tubulin suppressor-like RCC1 family protein